MSYTPATVMGFWTAADRTTVMFRTARGRPHHLVLPDPRRVHRQALERLLDENGGRVALRVEADGQVTDVRSLGAS